MLHAMMAWGVGFFAMVILINVLKIKGNVTGIAAVLFLTLIPYAVGSFLFAILEVLK